MSYSLRRASGQANTAGDTVLVTPEPGKHLLVQYCSYNPKAAVEAGFRFGSGTIWLKNDVVANSVISKDFGPTFCTEGATDEDLRLNLSASVVTNWTVFYQER